MYYEENCICLVLLDKNVSIYLLTLDKIVLICFTLLNKSGNKKYNQDAGLSRLYYYNRNIEVDFFVPDEALAIQVSYSVENTETRKRETAALVALNKIHPTTTIPLMATCMKRSSSSRVSKRKAMEAMVSPVLWKRFTASPSWRNM